MATTSIGIPGEAWGLVGVGVGWGLTAITEAIRHHVRRKDEARDLAVRRGEELVEQCHQAFQWMEDAKLAALSVPNREIRTQTAVMRAVAIVEMYYPGLSDGARQLDTAATKFRNVLIAVAAVRAIPGPTFGKPLSSGLAIQLENATRALMTSIGVLLTEARNAVRAKVG
jgi:hypothetical protein